MGREWDYILGMGNLAWTRNGPIMEKVDCPLDQDNRGWTRYTNYFSDLIQIGIPTKIAPVFDMSTGLNLNAQDNRIFYFIDQDRRGEKLRAVFPQWYDDSEKKITVIHLRLTNTKDSRVYRACRRWRTIVVEYKLRLRHSKHSCANLRYKYCYNSEKRCYKTCFIGINTP